MDTYHGILQRYQESPKQTLGKLRIYKGNKFLFACETLELPDKNNACCESRIPSGDYEVLPYSSAKYPEAFSIPNVKDRSNILIHNGNFNYDILGCILVGDNLVDIDNDGSLDVTNSVTTLSNLTKALENNKFDLVIKNPSII